MFSKQDFESLKALIQQAVDDAFDDKLPNYIKNLPTKDEFFKQMDALMKEIKASREEQTAISG